MKKVPVLISTLAVLLCSSGHVLAAGSDVLNEVAIKQGVDMGSLQKSAEQGDADGQFRLGYMYSKGQGVPQDDAEAVKWFRKAAEQGYAHGQTNLGFMYREGRGVPQDKAEAVKWYRKAAKQGNAYAQGRLGDK